jgi:hypothetical protein
LVKTATIDCPVASIGSTINRYLSLKSAMAVIYFYFKIIIVEVKSKADTKPFSADQIFKETHMQRNPARKTELITS